MDEELEGFKQLDLREYAASIGYAIDRRESSRNSTVMRRDHDKIIVSRKPDGHYTYWSPRDDQDRGTIIDFVQRRKGLSLGAVRKELRGWLRTPPPNSSDFRPMPKASKDLSAVRHRYAAMDVALRHAYLEEERGIPAEVLQDPRFAGRVRIDEYSAAVFPHYDLHGKLCGYELKNRDGFTGFAPGGSKGLFLSNDTVHDNRLVITESGIDVLSYAALFDGPHVRYGSIGGKPTPAQHAILGAAISRMPHGSEIVAAMDADDAGERLADWMEEILRGCGRADLTFRRDRPATGKDWNDMLRSRRRGPAPRTTSDAPTIA
jgi:Protein of unknown function (DUF3991)/Toprim-like